MTNIGNEKSPNRVYRNIVPIVPVPPMESTQTIEHQSLRGRNNKNFIAPGPYFPAFYRSICSRFPVFVVQTKGSEECPNGLHHRSIRQTLQTTDRHMTRLGKLRTKSLRTIQPDFFILNKNRRVLGTQSNLHRSIRVTGERFPKHPPKSQIERVFGRTNNPGRAHTC